MPPRNSTDLIRGDRENLYDVEEWYSPSQAGQVLGTSGQWITVLCRQGKLRSLHTALGWLVDPEDLERVRDEREVKLKAKLKDMSKKRTVKKSPQRGRITHEEARAAARAVNERRANRSE